MKRLLIRLLEWLTGEHVGALRESLRVTEKLAGERERALAKLHALLEPGEPWYSWQRVYQNAERTLAVVRAADRLNQCLAEFDECSGACGEYFDALHDALAKCQGTRTYSLAEQQRLAWEEERKGWTE